MTQINPHYLDLKTEYLFPIIERKAIQLKEKFPDAQILNLGVGDVSLPLSSIIAKAISDAAYEMTSPRGMRGYGPAEGYSFLREKIIESEYANLGIASDEVFISDGINSDCVNLQDLFTSDSVVAVPDPCYPAYLNATVLRGNKVVILPCLEENNFIPKPPKEHCDFVYLCSPSNPTGVAYSTSDLQAWINYAKEHNAILIYDNAYMSFIQTQGSPVSIFSVPGAHEVAIELRSFSKSAGFTGLRCAYSVISKQLQGKCREETLSIHTFWKKRQNIKFNGLAYPIQKGAEAVFSKEGQAETKNQIKTYLSSAKILRSGLEKSGYKVYGGLDAPYIWWKIPSGLSSWDFFDALLEKSHLITIPGKGFGTYGEGYMRLSSFITPKTAENAIERISKCNLL